MAVHPEVDAASPLQFVINAAAGSGAADTRREVIETALRATGRRGVKVAFDGEVTRMRAPLDFRVLAKPLYLLMPRPQDAAVHPDGTRG